MCVIVFLHCSIAPSDGYDHVFHPLNIMKTFVLIKSSYIPFLFKIL